MPVIGHEAEAEQIDFGFVFSVQQQLSERLEISRLPEDRHPPVSPIEHVINDPAHGKSRSTRHAKSLTASKMERQQITKRWMSPFTLLVIKRNEPGMACMIETISLQRPH